ncbi:PepSY-associated TM helix domain-containing protein [Herbaspirillum sp. AP02]|uniref:PepSY-associated TM helix domain-containing protein n=1 Tax=unclassified Herbaspirillum TaxID=2624150 RepID=UPI0015DBBC0D|nr:MULTISPECIES: PepSY-associated TM helix domain-containing protein [unclassified Herbaspirillum]MBG7618766.1 PepSY-associated TM helix domain-containing protein [Herbaspirillum sp. AP02]NZD67432.1 PepSY-associated TM helix domain-containing protein [Herbaspirillum sp. AP21]
MPDQKRRAFWLKHLHQWHWISSGICLVAMLAFAVTGLTLNHAAQIEAKPQVVHRTAVLPPALLTPLRQQAEAASAGDTKGDSKDPLPAPVRDWVAQQWSVVVGTQAAEWSTDEVYVALPRPGGDAWLRVALEDGQVEYEKTDRGWISYFNDLHKGRNTGAAWSWFIDVFAVACLVFCITGLFLLQMHAGKRPATWPLVALGLVAPLLLALLFMN